MTRTVASRWRAGTCLPVLMIAVIGMGASYVEAATPIPAATIALSPSTITSRASSTITWSSTDATSCTASGNWAWTGAVATSGTRVTSQSGSSTYHVTYTLTCTGAGGSAASSAILTVQPSGLPTVTLSATPTTINSGGSATLKWSSVNATACTASDGWTGSQATSGTLAVSPTSTTTYTLSCAGTTGSAQASTTIAVTVPPAPTVSFVASPSTITVGGSAALTWSSTNAMSCAASDAWSGTQATGGTANVAPATTGVFTYTLICTGDGGSGGASVSLSVAAAGQPVAMMNPTSLTFGGQATGTTSAAQTLMLSNTGTDTLAGVAISISGDFAQTDNCGASFAVAANCAINVTFAPTATGPRTGALTVTSNYSGGPVSVSFCNCCPTPSVNCVSDTNS